MAGKKNDKPGQKTAGSGKKTGKKAGEKREKKTGGNAQGVAAKKVAGRLGPGRPKVYSDAGKLKRAVLNYFLSISTVVPVLDEKNRPVRNALDEPMEKVLWLTPPTEGALARSLGISERTWTNYRDSEVLGPVVEWAKSVIRDYLLEKLVTKEKGNCNGLIFVLENNYGMKEQVAVEHSGQRIEEYLAALEAGAEGAAF